MNSAASRLFGRNATIFASLGDFGDEGAPIGEQYPRRKLNQGRQDGFVAHPQIALLVGNGCGVVAPACNAEAEGGITGETIIWSESGSADHNRAGAGGGIQSHVARTGIEVLAGNREGDHSFAAGVYAD